MPDIKIVCRECGREHKISEYAKIDHLKCAGCGAPLEMPKAAAPERGISVKSGPPKTPDKMPDAPRVVNKDVVPTTSAHDKEVVIKRPPIWQGIVVFLGVAGLMIYFLMHFQEYESYLQYYLWTRNILALGTYILILVISYHDGLGQGALCLIIPPYLLYYASSRLESQALRGLFFAVCAVLVAEVYYLPEHAVAIHFKVAMGEFVETVDGLIERAAQ